MSVVFHKGEFLNDTEAVIVKDNRAFRFADGFFESMRIVNGRALYLENHFARILDTAAVLKIKPSEDFSLELLRSQIQELLIRNNILEGGRMRITFYRKSTGFYLPKQDEMTYFIEAEPLSDNEFVLNATGRLVDIFQDFKKEVNKLSVFKTLNCQLYVQAAIHARDKGLDEALIQNNKLSIIESNSSNLFIVSNGVLYTPTLDDGCVAGTMRMNIINLALENKIKVYECTLNPHNLLAADEMFLTNAVRGIEWVVGYRTKRYFNDMSKKIVALLNTSAKAYGSSTGSAE
jgi:branched-subunit amino acid aminotransferase/4-amino-4-deoxychorismate lyase